jgi:hypothetical protein
MAFFCAATETSRDIIDKYANTPIGTLLAQKVETYAISNEAMKLPATSDTHPHYCTNVFVSNFMSLVTGYSAEHLCHMMRATMMGIYNVFQKRHLEKMTQSHSRNS